LAAAVLIAADSTGTASANLDRASIPGVDMKRVTVVVTAILTAGVLVVGCGDGKKKNAVTVAADVSLIEAFNASTQHLEGQKDALKPTYTFASSQAIVDQVTGGGTDADVVALADTQTMQKLVAANLVSAPTVIARNFLEIAVAPGNPKAILRLRDLEKPSIRLVLVNEADPAGALALQQFRRSNLPAPRPQSTEPDVKSALSKVLTGEADATLVYTTDVKAAGASVQGVNIPLARLVYGTYQIAVLNNAKNKGAALGFIQSATSGAVQLLQRAHGFLPPG
jgi:molybdate transport system substrate-binding protein